MGRILMKSLNSRKRNLRELAVWGSAENSFSSATWPGEPEGPGGQGFWRGSMSVGQTFGASCARG